MIFKVTNIVVKKRKNNPTKKIVSAKPSSRPSELFLFIAKKESRLLIINMTIAQAVSSSIKVACFISIIFLEVSTMKQSPRRLEEVLRMCGDLVFFGFMALFVAH
jgi:hypothetical protein